MPDDFILTLDSDSETEQPSTSARPSSSKRATGKSSSSTANGKAKAATTTPNKPEDEDFALDDEFALDFSGLDGARTNLSKTLGEGDFWDQDDQVQGGKAVSSAYGPAFDNCNCRYSHTSLSLASPTFLLSAWMLRPEYFLTLTATSERRRHHRSSNRKAHLIPSRKEQETKTSRRGPRQA